MSIKHSKKESWKQHTGNAEHRPLEHSLASPYCFRISTYHIPILKYRDYFGGLLSNSLPHERAYAFAWMANGGKLSRMLFVGRVCNRVREWKTFQLKLALDPLNIFSPVVAVAFNVFMTLNWKSELCNIENEKGSFPSFFLSKQASCKSWHGLIFKHFMFSFMSLYFWFGHDAIHLSPQNHKPNCIPQSSGDGREQVCSTWNEIGKLKFTCFMLVREKARQEGLPVTA